MKMLKHKRARVLLAGTAGLALVLGACGGADDLGGGGGGGSDTETDATGSGADCSAFEEYGTFDGETVTVFSSIREVEADQLQDTFEAFTECTGITVEHNGSGEFEQQVVVQAEGGNAPDIAIFPQPGLLQRMVADGHLVPAPDTVEANADEGWSEDWKAYGTVDGEFYAAPLMSSVKSFVWYSPSAFEENGYEVPETWDELMALTEQISADHGSETVKPWCQGIESGGATGWPATDWIEDLVLRSAGAEAYDQWVTGELAFNSPEIVEAVDMAGAILKNDDYTNGGIGDSRSIATTSFNDGGLPILEGNCFMHRQASFYEAQWPEGTDVSPDGDVFAFYLPGVTAEEAPLLVAGEFVGAFNDEEATQAVQAFMSSGEWANTRVEIGGVVSANRAVDPEAASSDVLRLAIELLQDENAVARFDGSDLMPSEVGAGSFWTGMVEWINGADTQGVLDTVEQSWP
ncbi:carbohydrate ABC transporter substrate-binding protein [Georgenia wutianyii]|uniref:Carbohydrate ABC transporter substrate-binding protein n=1 Tax=Georgenia wutianyii TaxID=2585135 RepID=A0ABX5VK53_9MICO|nr:ABC transporter substrate-binding protein [Georgenia wutianyii]QDB78041.1 carbohydrate ABC transporter substrate-binding protein [Georgenia wutianyii]